MSDGPWWPSAAGWLVPSTCHGQLQGRGMEMGLLLGSTLGFHATAGCQTEPASSRNAREYRCSGTSTPLCFPGDNCYSDATPCHLRGAPATPALQVLLQQKPSPSPARHLRVQRCRCSHSQRSDGEKETGSKDGRFSRNYGPCTKDTAGRARLRPATSWQRRTWS